MRKHYIDNLRTIVILLLFPVHTFMIWNNYGTKFYVWAGADNLLSSLIVVVNPWFMALLFVLAGMSARYSLEKRSAGAFVRERIRKLLVPFAAGVIFIVPLQTLYARKFFFSYDGSVIQNYKYFFTHFTDLSGYDGCFTPGHLWFILYLFIISIVGLLITRYLPYRQVSVYVKKIKIWHLILLFVPVWLLYYVGNFGGYSIGKYLLLYLIGYYVFDDDVIGNILCNKRLILPLFAVFQVLLAVLYFKYGYYGDFFVNLVGWSGVLACIAFGKSLLDRENKVTKYFKKASFPIYILHQTILVGAAYHTLAVVRGTILQVCVIMFGSFLLTIGVYEVMRRIPIIKKLIGYA